MWKVSITIPNTIETIDINLINIFIAGPEVSLNGSPTVSPTTAPLWHSEPLPPKLPASICFLALSQAPPELDIITAKTNPHIVAPASNPATPFGPSTIPTANGLIIAIAAITTSSF